MNNTIKNLLWRFAERCGAQFVTFVVSIILARILSPEHYGTIALITIFTHILQVFVDSGLGNALIQKKDSDDIDFSTVFYTNIVFCVFLYLILFFTTPLIAHFYNDLSLTPVIRVLGITILISGLKNIQQAYISKNLIFKKFFFATLTGTIISALVGIILAYNGFGVWSLVAQHLTNSLVDTIILWVAVKWKPKTVFSFERLKSLFSYGWKLLASNLLNTVYRDIRQLLIGKVYSASELAYYNQGDKFPNFICRNINTSIDSVLFPVMSKKQDNIEQLKILTRKSIMLSSFIMWPLLLGLAGASKNIVHLVLTDKWNPCIPYMIIACFAFGLEPIQTANLNAIKALGRSDLFLKMEIIKKTISTLMIISALPFGVLAVSISSCLYSVIATIINSYPNRKILNYKYSEQIRDILPSFLLSLLMGFVIYLFPFGNLTSILQLIIQIIFGIIFYFSMATLLKIESYKLFIDTLKTLKKSNKKE